MSGGIVKKLVGWSCALCLMASSVSAENWDMPVAYSDSTYHTMTAKAFAGCVGTTTNSALTITVHSGGTLLPGKEIKAATEAGNVNIGERLLSAHQRENAIFGIDSVPFLATSFEESQDLYAASKPVIARVLDEQGLHLLYSVPWPPQGLFIDREINAIEDMQGVRFRSYNQATARIAKLTGMIPVRVPAAELSTALENGTAQSLISSAATGYGRGVWKHLSHFFAINAWLPRNYVFVNKATWDALEQPVRDALSGCADMAEYAGYYRAREYTHLTMTALRDEGMVVIEPGGIFRAQLLDLGAQMATEWLEGAGPDATIALEAFRTH